MSIPVVVDSTGAGSSDFKAYTFAGSGNATITGGAGNDFIAVTGTGSATLNGGAGSDMLVHSGSGTGTVTMYGGAGNDLLTGNTATDVLCGGDGNDVLNGLAGAYYGDTCPGHTSGSPGNDTIQVQLGTGTPPVIDGGGGSDDVLEATLTGGADTLALTTTGAAGHQVTLTFDGTDTPATGIENLLVHTLTGADHVTVGDLASSGLTGITLDLGAGSPDTLRVLGSPTAGTTFNLSTVTRSGHPANEVQVARSGSYTVWIDNAVRSEGDTLSVEGGSGNDTIDASGITVDSLALTLQGGNGTNTLVGSPFDDVLKGGSGNDTMTGGLGLDQFFDTGGQNTLVEQGQYRTGIRLGRVRRRRPLQQPVRHRRRHQRFQGRLPGRGGGREPQGHLPDGRHHRRFRTAHLSGGRRRRRRGHRRHDGQRPAVDR